MKAQTLSILLLALLITLVPITVSAATFTQNIDSPVRDNAYATGNLIQVNAPISGDLYAAGQTITINQPIGDDAVLAAQTVTINAPIGGDVRIAAQTLIINSDIHGEVIALARDVQVKGMLGKGGYLTGQNIIVNGPVNGNLKIEANTANVDGDIAGNLTATATSLTLKGTVSGNVDQGTDSFTNSATVNGQLLQHTRVAKAARNQNYAAKVSSILSFIIVTLLAAWLFPKAMTKRLKNLRKRPGSAFLGGLLVAVLAPFAILLLFITLIGIPLALLGIVAYILAMLLAPILSAMWLGDALLPKRKSIWPAVLGALVLGILMHIPVLGFFVHALAILFGLGAMLK
ncbi:hypothetical protein AUJ68_06390 [Candidatus Woesearchaeota archaeon CG1_02_57_44]|nr:MAG: hypothetical protein AUJ68_06390 [Candidatus Woesearchaeota archaeon CG1_02_57_44]